MTQAYQLGDLGQLLTVDTVGNNITLAANSVVVGNASVNATINSTAFTGTANNTSFVGTVSAANVVSNAQLTANLANYQTTAGLTANIASYLPTYAGVVNAFSHTVGTAFIANNSQLTITTPLSANGGVGTAGYVLTTNGATGSPYWAVAFNTAAQYTWSNTQTFTNTVTFNSSILANTINAASYTVGSSFIANTSQLTITTPVSANGSVGTAGYVLTTNGATGSPYWAVASVGVNVAAQYTWSNTQTFTNTITYSGNLVLQSGLSANGSLGTANQVLTTNGSAVYWSTVSGGGGGALPARQIYTANGSVNTFTVTGGYYANNLDVYLNGVKLQNGIEANVQNGSTFTILTANPANGSVIEVVGTSSLTTTGVSTVVNQQITANGSANSFAITGGYIPNGIQVYLNGVKQIPGTDVFITSGANVGFAVTPSNNHIIDVYGYQTAVSYVSNTIVVGNTTIGLNQISVGNSSVNTQIVAGNVYLNGSTLVVGNTATNTTITGSNIVVGNTNIGLNNITSNGTANSYFMGSVGIGTNSPACALHISGSGSYNQQIRMQDTSVSNRFFDISMNPTGPYFWSNNDPIQIYTTGVQRMQIDSSGRVTKPYQPAFLASGSGTTYSFSPGSYLPFNSLNSSFASSNRSSGYNTSTYLYTAPVAGLYFFNMQLYINPSATSSFTWWKNGSQLSYSGDSAIAAYISSESAFSNLILSGSVTLELAAGDYVGIQVRTGNATTSVYMGHSTFSGHLIG